MRHTGPHSAPKATEEPAMQIPSLCTKIWSNADQEQRSLNEAIAQASAPNLTLTERQHRLLDSVDTPIIKASDPSQIRSVSSQFSLDIDALQKFQTTKAYKKFKSTLTHTFRELDAITNSGRDESHQQTKYQKFAKNVLVNVNQRNHSVYGEKIMDVYLQACPDARRLVRMHAFAKQRADLVANDGANNTRACISELSQRLDVCANGIVQYFDEAVKNVRQLVFTPSLPEQAEHLRVQIAKNAIAEYINQRKKVMGLYISNEIHQVAAWQNHFSKMFNLPVVEDPGARAEITANSCHQAELAEKLSMLQTGSVVSEILATQILEEAKTLWSQAQASGITDLTTYSMTLLEKLANKHGPIEPHTLMILDNDGLPQGIHEDPTLLTAAILKQVDGSPVVNFVNEPATFWGLTGPGPLGYIGFVIRGRLVWMETSPQLGPSAKPEQHLVSFNLITQQQFRSLMQSLVKLPKESEFASNVIHQMMVNDWGKSWPPIHKPRFENDKIKHVMIDLMMGIANGKKVGDLESRSTLGMLAQIFITKYSQNGVRLPELRNYTTEQILTNRGFCKSDGPSLPTRNSEG